MLFTLTPAGRYVQDFLNNSGVRSRKFRKKNFYMLTCCNYSFACQSKCQIGILGISITFILHVIQRFTLFITSLYLRKNCCKIVFTISISSALLQLHFKMPTLPYVSFSSSSVLNASFSGHFWAAHKEPHLVSATIQTAQH